MNMGLPRFGGQGRIWLMSGHHSFTLEEQGGFHSPISVVSVGAADGNGASAAASEHSSHIQVKLNGYGKPTVPLYARPDFAAAIARMGVSREVLGKLSCRSSASICWRQVGYGNHPGRELWAPTSALIFLGDSE
jgi:hypothetical protein